MIKNYIHNNKTFVLFLVGLFIFFGLNLFSSITMGVHFDEAYYWLYSQHPDFGYFDHPPMIGWLIYLGQLLFENTLGLRLIITVLSSCSVYILWILSKRYGEKPLLFWALIYLILLIHPYTFIATPDAPLFFFSCLFFLFYKRYLENEKIRNTILLAVIIALMIYSKYHALLVIMFTILSNIKLLKKKSFWIVTVFVTLLLLPHLFWQIEHKFISFQYHLVDSHKTAYNPIVTLNYIVTQLLFLGSWFGWLFIIALGKEKISNKFEAALKWTGIGTLIFFLIITFFGDFEAHWTLIATIPIVIVSYKYLINKPKWQRWVIYTGGFNFILLLTVRIIILTPLANNTPALGTFKGWDKNTKQLKNAIGEYPILFQDSWNKAARFAWYTNDPNITNLNSALHRKNQFDIWDIDEKLSGQTVCIVAIDSTYLNEAKQLKTAKLTWYYKIIENFHSYYNIELKLLKQENNKQNLSLTTLLNNPYKKPVEFGNEIKASFQLYTKNDNKWQLINETAIDFLRINPNEQTKYIVQFHLNKKLPAEVYLMLKIGELQPIPSICKIQ